MIVKTQSEVEKNIPNFELGDIICIEWIFSGTGYYLVSYASTSSTEYICLRNMDGLTYVCKYKTVEEIKNDLEKNEMFKNVKVFSTKEYKLILTIK